VTHYRVWIVFTNIDRVEAFNDLIKTHFAKEEAESSSRKKKRQKNEEHSIPGTWKHVKYSDLVHVICQTYMSTHDEVLDITFDHAASSVMNGVADDMEDDEVEDPVSSLIFRISAHRTFDSDQHDRRMDEWDVSPECLDIASYVTDPDDSTPQFLIPKERAKHFQRLSGNGAYAWLSDVDSLHEFCLPHITPTKRDMKEAVQHSLAVAGLNITDMSDEQVEDHLRSTVQGAYLKTPIRRSEVVSAIKNNSWSVDVLRVALPAQYELQMTSHKLLEDVRNGYAEGNLPLEAVQYVDNYLLSLAKSLVTPGLVIEGFPSGPQRVTEQHSLDVASFNAIMQGRNKRQAGILKAYYFPQIPQDAKKTMARPSFWFRTLAEYFFYDAALSGQQVQINMGVNSIAYGVDYPGFGKSVHIMATGPPAVGKSWAFKVAQANICAGKVYVCNSESKYAATYQNIVEQCVVIQDENENAKSESGTTGQLQSILVDGVVTRVRADVDKKEAVSNTIANRRSQVVAGNDRHKNEALSSRYLHLQVTGDVDVKQASAYRKQSDSYALGCLSNKVMTGRTVAVWMMVMVGLLPEPDTRAFEVFCAIHAAIFPDSVLKENPRTKDQVLTMATFSSLMHQISYYERINAGVELKDLFCVSFLNFLRQNWVVDPYSIIFASMTQLGGTDPQAKFKVLSLLKNHIQRDAQDRVVKSACCKYYKTTLYREAPVIQDLTNEIGIGYAIFEDIVQTLMVKSGAQLPLVITESQGYKNHFYCILPQGCANIRTLSGVEKVIVQYLFKQKAKALVSSNQDSLVFPQHVRQAILQMRVDGLKDCSDSEINAAVESLAACGIHFYSDDPVLKLDRSAQVMIVQPHQTDGCVLATPGGFNDPDFTGNVWCKGGMILKPCIEWKMDAWDEYNAIISGHDPLIEEKQRDEGRVIDYFMHTMQTPGQGGEEEEVYTGITNKGEVLMHEVQPVTSSLFVNNPDYRPSSTRRMSTGAPEQEANNFFAPGSVKVDVKEYTSLMEQAQTKRMESMLYGHDMERKIYGKGGLLFDVDDAESVQGDETEEETDGSSDESSSDERDQDDLAQQLGKKAKKRMRKRSGGAVAKRRKFDSFNA